MFCGSGYSGLQTGTKLLYKEGKRFREGVRLAVEVDARDDSCGGDGGVGRHTVSFFIDGEQQPYNVFNVPKDVFFGVYFIPIHNVNPRFVVGLLNFFNEIIS
jgi:hypothetical protein